MIVKLVLSGMFDHEHIEAELSDERFVKIVVTRKATWRAVPVELTAWGLSPAPFMVFKPDVALPARTAPD